MIFGRASFVPGAVVALAMSGCASSGDPSAATGGAAPSGSGSTSASAVTSSSGETASSSTANTSTGAGAVCGNGVIEPGESCEGGDFGGKTCESYGLAGGSLACNAACTVVLGGCSPAETCTNQADDDGDGLVDCDDPDCAGALACTDACASPTFVGVPSTSPADNSGFPDILHSSCMPSAGREVVYRFVAPATEEMVVRVAFPAFDAGLAVRTACDDEASEIACVDQSVQGAEQIVLPAIAGQTYFVLVESITGETGFYQLEIEENVPEATCDDFVDDDFDGLVDCDDPSSCQGSALCTPGSGAVGTPCLDNPECAANAGDPVCLQAFLGYPNGYCSEFCDLVSNDCPGDAQCADLGISAHGVCLDGCSSSADCRPGYACVDRGLATKVCDKPPELVCDDTKDNDQDGLVDCEDATSCSASPECVPGTSPIAAPCQLHHDCAAAGGQPFCIDQFNFGWPGGYCSEFCDLGAGDCPAGAACSAWISFASGHGLCFRTCTTAADCPLGYSCLSDGSQMICVE